MKIPNLTDQGFLENWQDWTEPLAYHFAQKNNLDLATLHWAVIAFVRDFFQRYEYCPTQRFIVKHLQAIDSTTSSTTLKKLFPEGPRQICLIAGLPKPARCI